MERFRETFTAFLFGRERGATPGRYHKILATLLLTATVLFGLVFLYPELSIGRHSLNDSVFHYTASLRMSQALGSGENPLDCWVGNYALGYPVWRSYQPLPHFVTALLFKSAGTFFSTEAIYTFVFYLLLSLLPLCFYLFGRSAGLGPVGASVASALSLTVSAAGELDRYGIGYGAFVWRGSGLYTQLWGLIFMLCALGAVLRSLRTGRGVPAAGLLLALTGLSHIVFGYMALLSAVLCCLAYQGQDAPGFVRRLHRTALVSIIALVLMAFFLVPLWLDGEYINHSRWEAEWKWNSLGAEVITEKIVGGLFFDAGRWPVLTILVGLGALLAAFRARGDRVSRIFIVLSLFWLMLFFGRHTWGHLLRLALVPEDLPLHRLQTGFQVFALYLAALLLQRALSPLLAGRSKLRFALAVALVAVVATPLYLDRYTYLKKNEQWGRRNLQAHRRETTELRSLIKALETAQRASPGRIHAGRAASWGGDFKVGDVPVYGILTWNGFHTTSFLYHAMSAASDTMMLMDERRAEDYSLFGIRYLVASDEAPKPGSARTLGRFGRFLLLQLPGTGYFDLVTVPHAYEGQRSTVFEPSEQWLRHPLRTAPQHIALYLNRAPAGEYASVLKRWDPLPRSRAEDTRPRGRIISQSKNAETFGATLEVFRDCHVLFKASFHPGLTARVDGEEVQTVMVTPGFMAFPVASGTHQVEVAYDAGLLKPALLLLGVLAFLAAVVASRRGFLLALENRISRFGESVTERWRRLEGKRTSVLISGWRRHAAFIGLVLLLSLIAMRPCFRGLLMAGHDATAYPPRVVEFHENIRTGAIPPLWAPDLGNGHGQPLFGFVPPVFFAVAELFYASGASLADGIQLAAFALGLVAALALYGIGIWFGSRRAGLVMAAAYLLSPYLQTDLYVRGNYAELAALCLFPVALWSLLRVTERPTGARVLGAGAAVAVFLLSHNAIALMGLPVLLVLALVASAKNRVAFAGSAASIAAGTGLAAFHLIPALLEKHYVKLHLLREPDGAGSLRLYFRHFVSFDQLLYSPWGYGLSVVGDGDGMSFMLGPAHLALAAAGVYLALRRSAPRSVTGKLALAVLLVAATGAFMSTPASGLIWAASETIQYTHFPWRFLALPALALSLLSGLWLVFVKRTGNAANLLAFLAIGLLLLFNLSHAQPSGFLTFDDEFYAPRNIAEKGIRTATYGEYDPRWVTRRPVFTDNRLVSLDTAGDTSIEPLERRPDRQQYRVKTSRPSRLRLNTFYYPGWQVLVDGGETRIEPEVGSGRILFPIPPGEHTVTARLTPTPLRLSGRWTSILTLLVLSLLVLGERYQRRRRNAG